MTKTEAEKKLLERRRRCARKRGPMSIQFTAPELAAVTVLSAAGRMQETIARDSGLSLSSFKRALDASEDLRDAWHIGKAIRREQRIAELEGQSKKGSTRATELLLRYEHRDAGPSTAHSGGRGDVTVNINAESIARAVDGRTFSAALKRISHDKPPNVIEHAAIPARPEEIDPTSKAIAAVKEKQRIERT